MSKKVQPPFARGDRAGSQHDLFSQPRASVEEAPRVAAQVQETDLLDLQARLAQTAQADLTRVYHGLLRGSGDRLCAFAAEIERQSAKAYRPMVLNSAINASLAGSEVRGGFGGGLRGRGGGRSSSSPSASAWGRLT